MVNCKNEKMGKNKIACFILTFNRLHLLKKCVEGVRNQSYTNFDIYVVDNASTDDTAMWLSQQEDIQTIKISKNEGIAKGFNVGIQVLYERGYDWIWMMDDDGIPDKEQLKELVDKTRKYNLLFANAIIYDINNPSCLAFSFDKDNTFDVSNSELKNGAHAFNGTFIHRTVVELVGNVNKEMYMYGCEIDYLFRIKKRKIKLVTVTTAKHFHPQPKLLNIPLIWGVKRGYVQVEIEQKYFVRNTAYIECNYLSKKTSIFTVLKSSFYFLTRLKVRKMIQFYIWYIQGYRGKLGL